MQRKKWALKLFGLIKATLLLLEAEALFDPGNIRERLLRVYCGTVNINTKRIFLKISTEN